MNKGQTSEHGRGSASTSEGQRVQARTTASEQAGTTNEGQRGRPPTKGPNDNEEDERGSVTMNEGE